ncbi:MAG: RagB/SusD family nutrient uptake outer membrane protein [Bacteroidaceae bacterium]|nr:RagB/SusD family nutrient uptake outer membrane protein [Bacteroidaceae bacterium]
MKKQYLYLLFILVGAVCMTSCESWLDETSNSEIREEDHFSTEVGFRQSLIGCYINMTDESLYGKELSWGMVETLGRQFQPYTTSASSSNYYIQNYNYKHSTTVARVENIWAKAYNVIANANAALAVIDEKETMMNPTNYSVIKGEFLAIRAYMHFELMRLYGYGNWAGRKAEIDAKYAVPYVKSVSKNPTNQVKTSEFFKLLIADLEEAAKYLAEDPVTGKHEWSHYEELNEDGFYDYRNLHLNYYAVKALQARVYLWEGSADSKAKALAAATEVIDDYYTNAASAGTVVRWMGDTDFNSYPALALEHIFGLNINAERFNNLTAAYLKTALADTDDDAYYLTNADTYAIYENSNTDYRFTKLLQSQLTGIMVGFLPLKLHQTSGAQQLFSYRIPLMRMPEMYYIAAECHLANNDVEAALDLLTVVRNQRGVYEELDATMSVEQAMEEIKKEYHKEFLLEGVMFYYYKRTGADELPNMETPMTDAEYVLPYPEFELQNGRIQ